jgi:cyclopropane-fatty-acyl-phospholipid synthase
MALNLMIDAMEKRILPDPLIRFGIRRLCKQRLRELEGPTSELSKQRESEHAALLMRSPLAVHTDDANKQHYELPPDFFGLVLGKNRKYSSCYWPEGCRSLDEAEDLAIAATIKRAQLQDGMTVLELGCGWGSLTLAMAKKFPNSRILALSNSAPQRHYILEQARGRGISNIQVITKNITDVTDLTSEHGQFDRIVSVEMFEHLRNYDVLLERISQWLKPDGKLFVHIFTHRKFSYFFETEGDDNWMGKYFFTGGQMPSHNLLPSFQRKLRLEQQWSWNGVHYQKTSEAWLRRMDENQEAVMGIFARVYGHGESARWFQRWRVFFMSCAELFGYRGGSEWGVSHYLFGRL